jgi:nucleoside-diphosphate-sugar epimerase
MGSTNDVAPSAHPADGTPASKEAYIMRVFVTGASGWIGSAVVPELLSEGHEVVGLARSDAAAEKVAASGAEVLRGDIQDIDVLRAGAEQADGVVHLAFRHDVAFAGDFDTALASNQRAIETFGEALARTGRPFAIASGIPSEPGHVATERDRPEPSLTSRPAPTLTARRAEAEPRAERAWTQGRARADCHRRSRRETQGPPGWGSLRVAWISA